MDSLVPRFRVHSTSQSIQRVLVGESDAPLPESPEFEVGKHTNSIRRTLSVDR